MDNFCVPVLRMGAIQFAPAERSAMCVFVSAFYLEHGCIHLLVHLIEVIVEGSLLVYLFLFSQLVNINF